MNFRPRYKYSKISSRIYNNKKSANKLISRRTNSATIEILTQVKYKRRLASILDSVWESDNGQESDMILA